MRLPATRWKNNLLIFITFCGLLLYLYVASPKKNCNGPFELPTDEELVHPVIDKNGKVFRYTRRDAFIFIGGMPRSGTTLARAILDAHLDVRCGEETRVVPRILQMRSHWAKSEKESMRLEEAGVHKKVLDSSIAAFIIEVIAKHGEPAKRLCNKDPFTMKSAVYLSELFPNGKFIFMVRDGRATVHSIISRKVTITGFDLNNYESSLKKWNQAIETMHEECKNAGSSRCMMVCYEQLVLHPKDTIEKVLKFLDLPWDDMVLHHEELINKPGGISLSKVERSSDQVVKPINLEALTKWVGKIPLDVLNRMAEIAPMLEKLGYDPNANTSYCGAVDPFFQQNTLNIKKQESAS